MDSETRNMIVVIVLAVAVICAGWLIVSHSSGVNPPFTVVESHSMQHGSESEIGVIDTGDLVLVRSTEKTEITTYIEGYQDGYETFGDYGDVIIYNRDSGNPVIHRAFIWLSYNGDGTWTAESLKDYDSSLWDNDGDYDSLYGILTFYHAGNVQTEGRTLTIDLDILANRGVDEGYLTAGDYNPSFDQTSGIYSRLVNENIKSVAWKEIPWMGSIKLMVNGNDEELDVWASNSIPLLVCEFMTVILVVIALNCLYSEIVFRRRRQ